MFMFTSASRIALLAFLAAVLLFPTVADAQRMSLSADELRDALRTARPEENGFIDDVVDRVNNANRPANERLPAAMVESTFHWARGKNTRYRFQYFRRGLTVRAAKIGVRL
jgi:hypothetical protein